MSDRSYEGWVVVFRSGTDFEADLVRDRLDDAGIPAVVLTQRDHAFNMNVGDFGRVNVMIPPDRVADAAVILDAPPPTEAELDAEAMSADPIAPSAHDRRHEAMLDSGMEEINLSPPDELDGEGDEPVRR